MRILHPIGLFVLLLTAACTASEPPTAPAATGTTVTAPDPPAPPVHPTPPEAGPFRLFTYVASVSATPAWYTSDSQFRLYDNGSFTLQYPHVRYRGTYTETDGTITFAWDGWSVAGPWEATGTLSGNALTVRYNSIMLMSDFEDAVYERMN